MVFLERKANFKKLLTFLLFFGRPNLIVDLVLRFFDLFYRTQINFRNSSKDSTTPFWLKLLRCKRFEKKNTAETRFRQFLEILTEKLRFFGKPFLSKKLHIGAKSRPEVEFLKTAPLTILWLYFGCTWVVLWIVREPVESHSAHAPPKNRYCTNVHFFLRCPFFCISTSLPALKKKEKKSIIMDFRGL